MSSKKSAQLGSVQGETVVLEMFKKFVSCEEGEEYDDEDDQESYFEGVFTARDRKKLLKFFDS